MKQLLISASNWKTILPLFILFSIFSFFLFPHYQSKMSDAAGEEVVPLDTRFSYNSNDVRSFFEKLGNGGRETYLTVAGKIDMVYPVVYGLLFILAIASLLKRLVRPDSGWIFLALLPLAGMLFDYVENVNTVTLLQSFPDIDEAAVSFGETATQAKHILLLGCAGIILVCSIVLGIRWIAGRTKPRSGQQPS